MREQDQFDIDDLFAQARKSETVIDNDGFSDRVMSKLPKHQGLSSVAQAIIMTLAVLSGIAIVLAILPPIPLASLDIGSAVNGIKISFVSLLVLYIAWMAVCLSSIGIARSLSSRL